MTNAIHDGRETVVIDLWHQTVRRLALAFFPLTCLLLITARDLIVMLFTESYLASVPIFMVSLTAIVFAAIPIDGLLRVYAKTRTLLAINLLRVTMIALLIHWSITALGLIGAIFVTMLALAFGKAIGIFSAASLWHLGIRNVLPWRVLGLIAVLSLTAGLPALAVAYGLETNPFVRIVTVGTVYVFSYVVMATGLGLLSVQERAALSELWGRLQFFLPIRYQHKMS